MEYLVEKIGMTRTLGGTQSDAITLVKLVDGKVCELKEQGSKKLAIFAYARTKAMNNCIKGMQKKYGLSAEYNKFASLDLGEAAVGDLDKTALESAGVLKVTFKSKGRGFAGVMKRHGFAGGPKAHGSRFHRRIGAIGCREFPGRVMKGKRMSGHFGNETVSVRASVHSFDAKTGVLALKGCVPGANGAFGRIEILKAK